MKNNNGMFILNKPIGITSNSILKKMSNIFLSKKIGHCGNLDIIATGLLPISFGQFNQFNKYINNSNKQYIIILAFYYRTETSDVNSNFISSKINKIYVNKNNLLYNIYKMQGLSYQKPHIFSAVKYKNKNLYEYTKYGIKLKKKKKYIYLNKIKIINDKIIKISCTKGTYIRSIIDYLGQKTKYKAFILLLHRINIGPFSINNSIKLEDLLYLRFNNLKTLNTIKNYILYKNNNKCINN
ncbi:MAG: tRNA pseudouridine(55) synthase TruB [Candidatus Azosocius agrarius]|nr:MAG: tRNA pseudouridine(55) synthase TruB [Gammaproteobacteria bacterium]